MVIDYQLRNYKGVNTLSNQGVYPFSYTLSKVSCQEDITIIATGTISNNSNVIVFIKNDGNYLLNITDIYGSTPVNYIFPYYNNLLLYIIKSTEKVLCNCKCQEDNCNDNIDLSCLLSSVINYSLLYKESNEYLTQITNYFICRINENLDCNNINLLLYGKNNKNCGALVEDTLVMYFLSFYYYALSIADDADEVLYVKNKYNSATILKCIKKLGVNLTDIENLVNNT